MTNILHGGRLDAAMAEYGGLREEWLDLSTGINPNPYLVPELPPECWERLPDESAEQALEAASRQYYNVQSERHVVAGNGTQAFIQLLPDVLAHKTIAVVSPSYEEHAHSWEKASRQVSRSDTLSKAVKLAEIVVVVNPNNPTGFRHHPEELLKAADALAKKSGFLIVDEAFCDVMPELSLVPEMTDNIIILRSFGKFFGLAGLRLGFAVCNRGIAQILKEKLGPWRVSGPALQIGAIAMKDGDWIRKTRMEIEQHSKSQAEVLEVCGLKQVGNAGLFMEFESSSSAAIHQGLLQQQILVRSFPKRRNRLRFGLCKDMDALERLAFALKKFA